MGRLTEVFDIIQNGFAEPEQYHWIEPEDEKTREVLKVMRRLFKKPVKVPEPLLFGD